MKIDTYYDQSELVSGAAGGVRDAILLGALLAGAVLFVFLRSPRLMAITAITLPAVLAATCLILLALHMSFNVMTLGGMAAAVGLVVGRCGGDAGSTSCDGFKRRARTAFGWRAASWDAAKEMARPLIGSSLSTIVVFLPLAFLNGVTGGFFRALAITMTTALVISLLFALFVAPLLGQAWLNRRDVEQADRANRGFADWTAPIYAPSAQV